MAKTHISNYTGRIRTLSSDPSDPIIGDEFWHSGHKTWYRWTGDNWLGVRFSSTSTSTSTSTTTTTSTTTS